MISSSASNACSHGIGLPIFVNSMNLSSSSVTHTELVEKTGVPRTKFAKLRSGAHAQPRYDDGVEIVKLYRKEAKPQQ